MLALANSQRILFVIAADGKIEGIVTGGDILRSLQPRGERTTTRVGDDPRDE